MTNSETTRNDSEIMGQEPNRQLRQADSGHPLSTRCSLSKFINCLMWDGKKATATRVFYDAMDQIKKRMPDVDPLEVFTEAVDNVKPTRRSALPARRRRQLPGADAGEARTAAEPGDPLDHRPPSRGKAGRPMFLRLAEELMAAYRREGEAMSKREQTIKMAEANKAFSHFAW